MTRTRKALVAGCAAAALIGGGGVAVASADGSASPTPTTTPFATSTSAAAAQGAAAASTKPGKATKDGDQAGRLGRLKGLEHAEWVAKDKSGAFVTHDAVRGAVTAVSPTSVTVKAADGASLTFAVTTDTRVRVRTAGGTGAKASVADLKTGEQVLVAGVKQPALTAHHIVASPG